MAFDFTDGSINRMPSELAEDPYWSQARNDILESLMSDAKGLPMSTAQLMLMERMASFYAIMRSREADSEVKVSNADIRASNREWLEMSKQFYQQLSVGEDKRRAAMLETILEIVQEAVTSIEDPRIREDLRRLLVEKFSAAGL